MCWMMLPTEKRNFDELRSQVNRLVERAICDMEEDQQLFDL